MAALVGCPLESDSRTCEAVNTFFFNTFQVAPENTVRSQSAGTVQVNSTLVASWVSIEPKLAFIVVLEVVPASLALSGV